MNYLPIIALSFVLAYSYYYGFTPLLLPLLFLVVSSITYFVYAKDKSAAQGSERRVPESRLHLYSLFFGWPGAIMAQQQLRHKTKKVSFRVVFWLTVTVNLSILGWVHTPKINNSIQAHVVNFESLLSNNISNKQGVNVIRAITAFNKKSF